MENSMPFFTWDCADELEGRLKKSLYHGGNSNCIGAVSPVALSDLAVSIYVAAAPMAKRKLTAGYIGSVTKRLGINPCTMMLGLLYCERLHQVNPEYLTKISSSDLFIISLVISSKFLNDEGEDGEIFNDEWAVAAGLGLSTINRLEREFLDALHWKAYVGPKEFYNYCTQLETRIALKHGLIRGWFSYTDLNRILTQIHYLETIKNSIHNTVKIVASCTLMYGLSVSVVLSSILCLNTTNQRNTSIISPCNDLGTDCVHPYASRQISRTRKTEGRSTEAQFVNHSLELNMQDKVLVGPALTDGLSQLSSVSRNEGQLRKFEGHLVKVHQGKDAKHLHSSTPITKQQSLFKDVRWDDLQSHCRYSKQAKTMQPNTQKDYVHNFVFMYHSTVNDSIHQSMKTRLGLNKLFATHKTISEDAQLPKQFGNLWNGNAAVLWIKQSTDLDKRNLLAVPSSTFFARNPSPLMFSGQK